MLLSVMRERERERERAVVSGERERVEAVVVAGGWPELH